MKIVDKIKKLGIYKSVRAKLVGLFLITTLLTSITSIFILQTSDNLILKMEELFAANVRIDEFVSLMDDIDSDLVGYLVTDDSDDVLNYYKKKDLFLDKSQSMFKNTTGVYSQEDLVYKDILYMVDAYLVETDAAVAARRLDDGNVYSERYAEARKIQEYIKEYAQKLNLQYLDTNTAQYINIASSLKNLMTMNIILIVSVICLNLIIIVYSTYNLTQPIVKLAYSAHEIADGNFESEDIIVNTDDELMVMADAFNGMKHSIKEYIVELKDKADTEAQLFEQKIENLEMQSLLDVAELKALQMQINPHFLFNTLNAAVQLATIEGADRTSVFLDDISKIFRYNVKSMDRVVRISDEIDMVKSYGSMFTVRFGDKIKFEYDIDESIQDFEVPPLIIQPFVENATIHGFGDREHGGVISIKLLKSEDKVLIVIKDNGEGMLDSTRKRILAGEPTEEADGGFTTGIGIHNVVHRLRLFFKEDDVLDIKSEIGTGTEAVIKIPLDAENKG